jgi:hypothetical protein
MVLVLSFLAATKTGTSMSNADDRVVSVRMTRAELYHRVWETPLVLLAPTLWLSDVGLRKRCVAMRIPLPGRGYWARKAAGQQVKRPPLPSLGVRAAQHHAEAVFVRPVLPPESTEDSNSGPLHECEEFEQRPENRVRAQSTLVDPHPLVADTVSKFKKAKVNASGEFMAFAGDTLDVDVSPAALDRALRLFDALIRALESRGFPTTLERIGYKRYTVVHLGVENVTLSMREGRKRSAHVSEPRRPGERAPMWEPKYDWTPTGLLSIALCPLDQPFYRHAIRESKRTPWEDHLNYVLVEIVRVQQDMRARQRDEEDRQVAEMARWKLEREAESRRAEEEKRARAFVRAADQWHECRLLNEYLAAVEGRIAEGSSEADPGVREWLVWARGYIERVNPLSDGAEPLRL